MTHMDEHSGYVCTDCGRCEACDEEALDAMRARAEAAEASKAELVRAVRDHATKSVLGVNSVLLQILDRHTGGSNG